LLRLGVFRFWTCVSGKRAVKGDKAELSKNVPKTFPTVPQRVPQNAAD